MDSLLGTWTIVELAGDPVPSGDLEVTFLDDGTLNGSTGVNRLRGQYVLADETLTVGPVITTRMGGPPEKMAREAALLALLSTPQSVLVSEEEIQLDDGSVTTRLVRMPAPVS
jgi:heat shock protein HslJ